MASMSESKVPMSTNSNYKNQHVYLNERVAADKKHLLKPLHEKSMKIDL